MMRFQLLLLMEVARTRLVVVEGVCTTLRLTFKGWTAAEVRGVVGESGEWVV